jgi:hypothetical protein
MLTHVVFRLFSRSAAAPMKSALASMNASSFAAASLAPKSPVHSAPRSPPPPPPPGRPPPLQLVNATAVTNTNPSFTRIMALTSALSAVRYELPASEWGPTVLRLRDRVQRSVRMPEP